MANGADGRKPTRTILLPDGVPNDMPYRAVAVHCSSWAAESGCEIEPQWNRPVQFRGAVPRLLTGFHLYGTTSQADAAVRVINKWIESVRNKKYASWVKMKAFDPNKWYYDQVTEMENERKQKFKGQLPEEPLPFEVIVPWPEEYLNPGINRTPRDAFGNKLEHLDPIRVGDEVFITLHSSRPWKVKIQGYEAAHVERAEAHYRNQVRSIRHKLIGASGSTPTNIILDEVEGTQVVLLQSPNWWTATNQIVPKLTTSLLDSGGFRNRLVILDESQEEIRLALENIRYSPGSYDLAVHFGCLSVAFKAGPNKKEVPLQHFKNLIQGTAECKTWKWLGEAELGEKLLERLMDAEHFLEPSKARGGFHGLRAASIKQTRPTFKALYVVKDPNVSVRNIPQPSPRNPGRPHAPKPVHRDAKPEAVNHVVIQLEWTEDEDGYYEKMAPIFYKLKPGAIVPAAMMDINLLELTESKAWHFGLEAMVVMPRSTVPPVASDLAKAIEMKPGYKNLGSGARPSRARPIELSIPWSNRQARQQAEERVVMTLLERLYTFTIKDTNYQVELSHKWYHERDSPLCGLSVRHAEWATHLGLLETLAPGCGADWDDVIKLFFPKNGITSADDDTPGDGEGLRLLVKKLMELSRIVQSASSTEAAAAEAAAAAATTTTTTMSRFSQNPVQQPTTLGARLADLNLIDLED